MRADDLIEIELDPKERYLLRRGLIEWGGPASCTEELAVAMGFRSVADLFAQTGRLTAALESGASLSRIDWCRVLLATEIVFASDVVGAAGEWEITTGLSDAESLATLRRVQGKLVGVVRPLLGHGFGSRAGV